MKVKGDLQNSVNEKDDVVLNGIYTWRLEHFDKPYLVPVQGSGVFYPSNHPSGFNALDKN